MTGSRLKTFIVFFMIAPLCVGCGSPSPISNDGFHYSERQEIPHEEPKCKGAPNNPKYCEFMKDDQLGFEIGWSANEISKLLRKMNEIEKEFFISFLKTDGITRLGVNSADYSELIELSEEINLLAYYRGKDGVQKYKISNGKIIEIIWEKYPGNWP